MPLFDLADGVPCEIEPPALAEGLWPAGEGAAALAAVELLEGEPPPGALAVGVAGLPCAVEGSRVRCWPGPQRELSPVFQLALLRATAPERTLLIHAAGLARGGVAVAALAPSGGGKSTLTTLAEGFDSLSDETVLLRPGPAPRASATPFRSSSPRAPAPRTARLGAFLILEKSLEPRFERVGEEVAIRALLAQAYRLPGALHAPAEALSRARALVAAAPAFRFAFPKSPEAAALLGRLFDEALG